jgi:hypothetical protein
MKREIPIIITFLTGILMIIDFFVPHPPFGGLSSLFEIFFTIIFSFATILGILALSKINIEKIYRKREAYGYNIVLLIGLVTMIFCGLVWGIGEKSPFDFIYMNLMTPMYSTMFSLLAFFVASASYRAFRARTPEATLLLVAAFFVMIGRVPLGDLLTNWVPKYLPSWLHFLQLPLIANWIMDFPNTAGQRAIMIGSALGIASTSLRLVLGIESAHIGKD